ncbi:MAG: copper resistance protein CopA [Cycloclasticus sp. symbiont of Poecilosclerida sp. M]|nr:MAG: copper resistance protein CopA [Cycloclasticus sp. symbiont of Poecilosclerida sp. M]
MPNDLWPPHNISLTRRRFVTGLTSAGILAGSGLVPSLSFATPANKRPEALSGKTFNLTLGHQLVNFTGVERFATSVNGSVPGPTLYWREGDEITINVTNSLPYISSVHWHGIILPSEMDGVPDLSFKGILPGTTFTYKFKVKQSGTYWYHSHSGFQEQTGLYGSIVVLPKEKDPVSYDRDYVVVLSDWSDERPENIYANLKKKADYYAFNKRAVSDLNADIQSKGLAKTWQDRAMWNQMRMSDRDLSDVTGRTYTFLMNGVTPEEGWVGLFKRGERVRLRFINAAAMTLFDVRIPGLKMTVVSADGQNVEPFSIDEFRIATAETYDVIVEPAGDSAYSIFAQAIDRSGYTRGSLTPDVSVTANTPKMDPSPILSHQDMGMDMSAPMPGMDHSQHAMSPNKSIAHADSEFGLNVDMRVDAPRNAIDDPGVGLRDHQRLYNRRVLKYSDLYNLYKTIDPREPSREIQLHLTGNMHRYMWSIDGIKASESSPINLKYGERVRFILVNDTMMTHPIHLHGMWSELETGGPKHLPRKHTIIVQPGAKASYRVTADALGTWAYHCHLLYHMPGMFRSIVVA